MIHQANDHNADYKSSYWSKNTQQDELCAFTFAMFARRWYWLEENVPWMLIDNDNKHIIYNYLRCNHQFGLYTSTTRVYTWPCLGKPGLMKIVLSVPFSISRHQNAFRKCFNAFKNVDGVSQCVLLKKHFNETAKCWGAFCTKTFNSVPNAYKLL